jgi:hypothetical protein
LFLSVTPSISFKNWFLVPKTLRIEIHGRFGEGVYAKDLILQIVAKVGAGGANYKACEFGLAAFGAAVALMSPGAVLKMFFTASVATAAFDTVASEMGKASESRP